MLRYYYVVVRNLFRFPGIIGTMRRMINSDQYSEEERYKYIRYITKLMQKTGAIRTEAYGVENLPEEGGYIMYPNHQGKYDAYGIVSAHKRPCTVVMDKAKSNSIFIREVLDMVKGKRLDKQDVRQGFRIMKEMAEEVKQGRRYVLFPEGWYSNKKKNTLIEFKAGCFKAAMKSQVPIVPVVLIDSYKALNSAYIGMVTTQVHFLPPIYYEEYKDMKTQEIAAMVRERIQDKIDKVLCSQRSK